MFDWNIVLNSFVITILTYLISGLLGYLVTFNMDQTIAISIGSTYKNSGVAFAMLLVALEAPFTYIAFVPCLAQVVTTSLTLYLFYSFLRLINLIRRRNQPAPIQASKEDEVGDQGKKSSIENDEFIVMNVTDIVPGSPISEKGGKLYDNLPDQPNVMAEVYNETTALKTDKEN